MRKLGHEEEIFRSCINSIQHSYTTVANVSSRYTGLRSVSRVFRLSGRGRELLGDRKLSIWKFLRGRGFNKAELHLKVETAYKDATVRPSNLHPSEDVDAVSEPQTSSSAGSPSTRPNLGKATLILPRVQDEQEGDTGGSEVKLTKAKKN